jgi:phosphoenolpyruvate synthase/pyruvate phosphate dikinase
MAWQKVVKVNFSIISAYTDATWKRDYAKEILGPHFYFGKYKYLDGEIYYDDLELKSMASLISENPIVWIPKLFGITNKECNEFIAFGKKINKIKFNEKNNKQLNKLFNQWLVNYNKIFSVVMVPIIIEGVVTKLLENELEKKIDPAKHFKRFKEIFNDLAISNKEFEVVKEQKELLKLAIEIKRTKKLEELFLKEKKFIEENLQKTDAAFYKKIENHLKKFSWTGLRFLRGEPISFGIIIDRLKEILKEDPEKELGKLDKNKEGVEKKFNAAIEEIKPGKEFKEMIELAREDIYLRTFRLEAINKGNTFSRPLFDEIASRMKITYNDMIYLLPEEINNFLDKNEMPYVYLIKERQKGFALTLDNGKINLYVGDELEKLKEEMKEEVEHVDEIKGNIACQGEAKGKVRIIHDITELSKIEKGDILVTQMTTPDFISAMKKAAAVVTDIGGITSHAAIVSRELGVPCIIGTEKATKILKDGDFVEVNAFEGVVRVIKRK